MANLPPELEAMAQKWPSAIVARSEVGRFTGGAIAPGTLANADCRGDGPRGRIQVGRRTCYSVDALLEWLAARCQRRG